MTQTPIPSLQQVPLAVENLSNSFQLARSFILGVPFSVYRLVLSHRLLDNLYAVSRFLLRAVASGAEKQTLIDVTALSAETIDGQLNYLCHQGYLDESFSLTEQGKKMVEMEKILPNFVAYLAIDKFSGKNIAVVPKKCLDEFIDEIEKMLKQVDASQPENRNVTQFDQQQSLSKILNADNGQSLLSFLCHLWPEHTEELTSQQLHLDYSVKLEHPTKWLILNIAPEMLISAEKLRSHEVGITVPVLKIQSTYQVEKNIPWSLFLPEPDTLYIERFGNTPCAGNSFFDRPDNENRVLPELDFEDTQPDLPSLDLPVGVMVHYDISKQYMNFKLKGSLMTHVSTQYQYIDLGGQRSD